MWRKLSLCPVEKERRISEQNLCFAKERFYLYFFLPFSFCSVVASVFQMLWGSLREVDRTLHLPTRALVSVPCALISRNLPNPELGYFIKDRPFCHFHMTIWLLAWQNYLCYSENLGYRGHPVMSIIHFMHLISMHFWAYPPCVDQKLSYGVSSSANFSTRAQVWGLLSYSSFTA